MVEYGKIFKCEDCGSIVEVLVDAHEEKACCDSSKNIIEPQTEGDKAPKHVPVISVDGNEVTVAVGEVQHPMHDTVDADLLAANEAIAREFCNLHGLWASQ